MAALVRKVRGLVATAIAPRDAPMPVEAADVIAADLGHPHLPAMLFLPEGCGPTINWVTTPAGANSGGHTTLHRIISYLEAHGYRNRVYFHDLHCVDLGYYESVLRRSYGFKGPVGTIREGMDDAHAVVATSWATAYPVFNARCAGKRFYFVQDFEPHFYPAGTSSVLAANTYRMGFHGITAGRWLAEKLRSEFRMDADHFEFGCDTAQYVRRPNVRRSGLVFYARREVARRAFELGVMAMEIVARRRPDLVLHFYGDRIGKLPFRFIDHGRLAPRALNDIYNQSFAGLSLSLTNVSLVPHEMLAAGCIPVVNDDIQNRIVLDNPFVRYAPLHPGALATELESVAGTGEFESLSRAAASSVNLTTWDDAGAAVDRIFRSVLGGTTAPRAVRRQAAVIQP